MSDGNPSKNNAQVVLEILVSVFTMTDMKNSNVDGLYIDNGATR